METEHIINSKDFLKLISNFGDIYLNYNNHTERISHGSSKKNIIKIITYKELLMELSAFENKTINYFIERGLDKNTNQKGNIALIVTTNRNKTRLESYDFSYKDESKKTCYDIPYYHKDVPEGFSVFCTDEEFELVIKHVNKRDSKPKIKEEKKEEPITSEPQPSKKNFICQLCRSRFDNYKDHIVSETHIKNIKKHKNSFNKLSLTFKRIVNNNCNISKENSIKVFSNKLYEDIDELFEFSPKDSKKSDSKQNYNLRVKKSPSFGKDNNNCFNYFMSSSKNNNIKIIRNENDVGSPQQQVSSTASSTFKNLMTLFEEASDINKNYPIKKTYKRKRDEEDDSFYCQFNMRNKRIKL